MENYEFTTDWFSMHTNAWTDILLPNLPKDGPRRILEIGSWEGRSACWLLDNGFIRPEKGDELVCVDTFSDPEPARRFEQNTYGRVTKVKSHSADYLLKCVQSKERFDAIYIDADHDAPATLYDGVLSWQILKPGGIMIFDDYRWEAQNKAVGVLSTKVAIEAFLSTYQLEISVLHKQYQVFVEKRKNPIKNYHWHG